MCRCKRPLTSSPPVESCPYGLPNGSLARSFPAAETVFFVVNSYSFLTGIGAKTSEVVISIGNTMKNYMGGFKNFTYNLHPTTHNRHWLSPFLLIVHFFIGRVDNILIIGAFAAGSAAFTSSLCSADRSGPSRWPSDFQELRPAQVLSPPSGTPAPVAPRLVE